MADPDEIIVCAPPACGRCGADLAAAPVAGTQKRYSDDIGDWPV